MRKKSTNIKRRKGAFRSVFREMLLSLLYQWEFRKEYETTDEIMDSFVKNKKHRFMKALRERLKEITEVDDELEALIKANTEYPYDKVDLIDKIILKIAIFEMLYKGIPPEISISEAVKLSRKFSSPNSYKFINGVLGQISRNVCQKSS